MTRQLLTRRNLILGGGALTGSLALSGCDRLSSTPWFRDVLASAERLTMGAQRLLLSPDTLAREFSEADLSPVFRANGTVEPREREYIALADSGFADWRLTIGGLVERPLSFSLGEIRALPARTQITRHDCVEGWSCIGKWSGPQLGPILQSAGLKPNARYVVFRCFDNLERRLDGSGRYYESIDLVDAFHPQTILAHSLNDEPLRIAHGAPLRLRVERHLGYKHAKYLQSIEVAESFADIGGGKGSFWADRGYEWYAGM
jgi:DMSO/TMAO reductase YedYZ molybdopterin-dependent catalytic subunit